MTVDPDPAASAEAEASSDPPAPPPRPGWMGPHAFDERRRLGWVVIGLLSASGGMAGLSLLLGQVARSYLDELKAGADPGTVAGAWAFPVLELTGLLRVLLFLVTGICFALWFRRKHGNLPALGADGLRYDPRWAAASFVIPILNLFRPYQIGSEVWRASDPTLPPDDPHAWQRQGWPWAVVAWWLTFIGSRVLEFASGRIEPEAPRFPLDPVARDLLLLAHALTVAAAWFAIQLVRDLDARQADRFARLSEAGVAGFVRFVPTEPGEDPEAAPALARAQCPTCQSPYRVSDYRWSDGPARCSRCRSELPAPTTPQAGA